MDEYQSPAPAGHCGECDSKVKQVLRRAQCWLRLRSMSLVLGKRDCGCDAHQW